MGLVCHRKVGVGKNGLAGLFVDNETGLARPNLG